MKNQKLFMECVSKIKRWPSLRSSYFPSLPRGCNFVVCAPTNGQYKLDINGEVFLHSDHVKAKK